MRKMPTYKGKNIQITSDLSAETLKSRKTWNNTIQALRVKNYQPKMLYSAKLSFQIRGEIEAFQDMHKLKQLASIAKHT
jgi:hypothetical protein